MSGFFCEALGKHDRAAFASGNDRLSRCEARPCRLLCAGRKIERKGRWLLHVVVVQRPFDRGASRRGAQVATLSQHSRSPDRWLGRDLTCRGQHIGSMLQADAITRLAAAPVGIHAICADAIDEAAATFYRAHQFQSFSSRPLGFYLPLKTALASIADRP